MSNTLLGLYWWKVAAVRRYRWKSSLVWIASTPASSCRRRSLIRSSRWACHWSCWVRVRLVMVGSSPSSPSKTGKQTCFPQGKSDKDGGERRQGRAGAQRRHVHWSGAETLAPEGVKPPESASPSDSALDAHARVSARGNTRLSGRQEPGGSQLRTA